MSPFFHILIILFHLDTSNSQPNDSNANQPFIDKEQLPVQVTSNSQTAVFKTLQSVTSMAPTFRPPLPPTQLRQRMPMPPTQQMVIRPKIVSQVIDVLLQNYVFICSYRCNF